MNLVWEPLIWGHLRDYRAGRGWILLDFWTGLGWWILLRNSAFKGLPDVVESGDKGREETKVAEKGDLALTCQLREMSGAFEKWL